MTQERVGMNSDSGLFELNSLSISRSFIQQVLLVVKALKVAQFPLTSSTRKTGIGSFGLSVNTASVKGSPFGRYKINGRVLALEVSPNTGVLQRETNSSWNNRLLQSINESDCVSYTIC